MNEHSSLPEPLKVREQDFIMKCSLKYQDEDGDWVKVKNEEEVKFGVKYRIPLSGWSSGGGKRATTLMVSKRTD